MSPGRWRWKKELVRHDYFSQIDNALKAYLLGFIAADGNVLPKLHRITIELSAKDQELLRLIRDELVPGGAITTRQRQGREYHTLAFVSRPMVADLAAFGITAAKSCILQWPDKLPDCYARAFILGLFDGDGFITYDQHGNTRVPYVGFTSGSPQLLTKIIEIIEHQAGVRIAGPWPKGNSKAFLIRVSGHKAPIVDQWLHADGLGLSRKRLVLQEI
ncbi:MAG TPA: LAGLIDADG family homing endonuclease [Ktedonobacterales bacterium]|nr:LAGLIDADG family homing endonuclease [Ktedonobacterales bacterium]